MSPLLPTTTAVIDVFRGIEGHAGTAQELRAHLVRTVGPALDAGFAIDGSTELDASAVGQAFMTAVGYAVMVGQTMGTLDVTAGLRALMSAPED